MEKLLNRLTAITIFGTLIVLASCSKDDDKKPSKPSLLPSQTTLNVKQDSTKTFTVNISASGGIKDITATTDAGKGTATITDKTSVIGKTVGTVTVSYTAPDIIEAADNVKIVVTDNLSQKDSATVVVNITANPPIEIASELHITQATTWGPNRTYHVTNNVFVEKGASLTVLGSTTVIVDGKYSFTVRGNFYSLGTATDSVVFTVPSQQRTKANIFGGLWGGILSSNTDGTNTFAANEMVVQYTRIEYTGMLGQANMDIVKLGEVADTNTPTYSLFFNNPAGTCVIQNSTFAYSVDVAVQVDQGHVLINNNAFILNGKAGGEAIDAKVGTYGDIAYNLFYKTATNGVKFNAKGGSAELHIYNNTAVECGWRQTSHVDHGGSFNVEQGGKGMLYNNLIVNCTRGVRFSNGKLADVAHLSDGYNFHYLSVTGPVGTDNFTPEFYSSEGFIIHGNGKTGPAVDSTFETAHDFPAPVYTANVFDVAATVAAVRDPKFSNFNASAFSNAAAVTAEEPSNESFPSVFDFHLQAGSPALTGGNTSFSPYNTAALTAGGKTFTSPSPSSYIGAFGTK